MAKRDDEIDAVFADMNVPRHPGAALLVIDHDEIVYSKCYGLADLETQRPVTTDTSFYLASISKQFTAMAIMMLAERGKLSFDDHLSTYFPRFPAWAAGITLRHMLHHTSGLPDYLPFFKGDEFVARDMNGITNEDVLQRATDAVTNACTWAVALHSALGLQAGLDPLDVEAMRAGRSPSDKKLGALSTLARTLIEKRGRLDEQDIERFLAAGFGKHLLLEVITIVAASTITNYTGSVTNPPLEAALQAHEWKC